MMLVFSFLLFISLLYAVVKLVFTNPALFHLLACIQVFLFVPAAVLDCALFLSLRRLPEDVKGFPSFLRYARGCIGRIFRRKKPRG